MTTFLSGKTFELTPEAKYYEESPLEGTHDRRIKIKVPIKEEGDEEEKKKKRRRRLTCQSSRGADTGALSPPMAEQKLDKPPPGQRANLVDPLNVGEGGATSAPGPSTFGESDWKNKYL